MTTSIGLDIGHSAVKAVGLTTDGIPSRITFPSLVTHAFPVADEQERARAELETVQVGGTGFFVGKTARIQGGSEVVAGVSDDWVRTPQYEALIASALDRFIRNGVHHGTGDIVVAGLPSGIYESQKEYVAGILARNTKAEVRLYRQPLGAYYSTMLTDQGTEATGRSMSESWAVVDVGYHTTDFLLMSEGRFAARADKKINGMRMASQLLLSELINDNIHVDIQECDEILATGRVVNFGQVVDVLPVVLKAMRPIVEAVIDNANRYLGADARRLHGVIVAGGGAMHVGGELRKKWPHVLVAPNPRMAIAEGFARFGRAYLKAIEARNAKAA